MMSNFEVVKEKFNMLGKVDMVLLSKAKDILNDFETKSEEFKSLFASKFKYWRQKNLDLQQKYEHINLLTKMQGEMNSTLRDEIVAS